MKIVADKRIPYIDQAFGSYGALVKVDSAAIDNAMVHDADAVIVRSETKVDEKLLTGSKVSFVGTATIGTDHVDMDFLAKQGIGFASAPGCNANAVAEYVFSALFALAERKRFVVKEKTIGVVGLGHVGSKVAHIATAIGMKVLENDPPLARSTGDSRFASLDELLSEADIITLHVPLTGQGDDRTYHLFDEMRLARMRQGTILMNSARGSVVNNNALKNALDNGRLAAAVLDVWEHEPKIDVELLSLCELGTPHIAGYSIDGKVNATRMIYMAFSAHFNLTRPSDVSEHFRRDGALLQQGEQLIEVREGDSIEVTVAKIVKQCYDVRRDDDSLRKITSVSVDERGKFFKNLRGSYRLRREFSNFSLALSNPNPELANALMAFGFKIRAISDGRL